RLSLAVLLTQSELWRDVQSSALHRQLAADVTDRNRTTCVGSTLSWLAIGDWGQPGPGQQRVASMMSLEATRTGADFVALVGDNFYPAGVRSWDDPQWKTTYEDVYHAGSLKVPHYAVLGNHDYRSNTEAQLEYPKRMPDSHFRLPARWYSRTFQFGNCEQLVKSAPTASSKEPAVNTALFIFIDTMVLAAGDGDAFSSEQRKEHWQWLEQQLREASADWIFIVGHHPVYSAGAHGDQEMLVQWLDPLLLNHSVDAYIAGHDHDAQLLKSKEGLSHIICGAGSK
ncbi:unnamed protein product, partial [Polarella glacialis]